MSLKGSGKRRILIVSTHINRNLKANDDEVIDWTWEEEKLLGIFTINSQFQLRSPQDYHIIICTPEFLFSQYPKYFLEKNFVEFLQFLGQLRGAIVIPLVTWDLPFISLLPEDYQKHIKKHEEEIILNEDHFMAKLIEKWKPSLKFYSEGYLHLNHRSLSKEKFNEVIGTNLPGNIVSWEWNVGGGKAYFLPAFSFFNGERINLRKESEFIRFLIDTIKPTLQTTEEKISPPWLLDSRLRFNKEGKLQNEAIEIEEELRKFERIRGLLWKDGHNLTADVSFVLSEIGISNENLEREGKEDIRITENTLFAKVEVTGSKGYAKKDKVLQLVDWITDGNDKSKGIFLINHYKEIQPEKRERAFSEDAIRVAESNKICLMTTYQLFQLYQLFENAKMDKNDILELVKSTVGELKIK